MVFLLAMGASRRPWVLGKVMEKEYCQAKKVQILLPSKTKLMLAKHNYCKSFKMWLSCWYKHDNMLPFGTKYKTNAYKINYIPRKNI